MPATLTIPVSDELLAHLQRRAAEQGTTPEELAARCLAQAPHLQPAYGRLRRLAGTLSSGVTDASVRTDEYITDTLLGDQRNPSDG